MSLNAEIAAQAAEHVTTNTPGYCFSRVSDYFGRPDSTGPGAGHYSGPAIALWIYSQHRHPGDRNPPRGAPLMYSALSRPRWSGDQNYAAGDVTLGLGMTRGVQRATDYPTNGRVGSCSIAQREHDTGRTYLGWIGDFMGNLIDFSTIAGGHPKPITPPTSLSTGSEPDMFLCHVDERVVDVPGKAGVRNATYKNDRNFIVYGPGLFREHLSQLEANGIASQLHANSFPVTAAERVAIKASTGK